MGAQVLQAEFTGVDDLVAQTEEQARLYRQQRHCFRSVLDIYEGNAYVSDMETYELLYVNQTSCKVLGAQAHQLVGRKCYEMIQGRTSPCPFCTNGKLCSETFYTWEFYNPNLERTFIIKDLEINWEGHRARLELSHDSFSAEYKLAKKDQERDALLNSVHGGFARVDARDLRTILWYGGEYLDIIGYTKEQFEQELQSKCTYVHPDDIDYAEEVMRQSRETGEATAVERRIVTRAGVTKIVSVTFRYVSAEDSWDGVPSYYSVGVDVTAETAPHYLLLTDADLQEDGRFKMNPPLRGEADRAALIEALLDGTIDMIATDHAPHSAEEKSRGLEKSAMGVVGLECAFAVLYTGLVETGVLTLERLTELMSCAPARRFKLPGGEIKAGSPANLAVFDTDTEYTIDPAEFASMGRATPFEGWRVKGKCLMTVCAGRTVWKA